jgi:hypothetical protein
VAGWTVLILLVLVVASVPVAAVLGVLTLALDQMYMDGRLAAAIGEFTWDKSKEFVLVAIPRSCCAPGLRGACTERSSSGCPGCPAA